MAGGDSCTDIPSQESTQMKPRRQSIGHQQCSFLCFRDVSRPTFIARAIEHDPCGSDRVCPSGQPSAVIPVANFGFFAGAPLVLRWLARLRI